jgi:hypothetical protein
MADGGPKPLRVMRSGADDGTEVCGGERAARPQCGGAVRPEGRSIERVRRVWNRTSSKTGIVKMSIMAETGAWYSKSCCELQARFFCSVPTQIW